MNFLGRRSDPKQAIRQQKRELERAIRELDRERTKLETSAKQQEAAIKKKATLGQTDELKIMAKDLVRTRANVKKFHMMKANLQAVSMKMVGVGSSHAMTHAISQAGKVLKGINKNYNMPKMKEIMQSFERENEILDMKTEIMDDTMGSIMDDDENLEEEDLEVQKIMDEIGINLGQSIASAPSSTADTNDILSRLESLKK